MQEIHDILPLISPPDYTNIFIFLGIIFLIIILFFLKNFLFPKKILEEEKKNFYSKEKFLEDFYKIKNFVEKKSEEDFRQIFWLELSKILKTYISENHHKKFHFLSFGEIKNIFGKNNKNNKIFDEKIIKIFEKFDKQFYFYEKKGKNEFMELVGEIEENLIK